MNKILITGSEAAALGAKLAKIEVLAYYPITPAFPAMERLSKYIDDEELNCKFIRVESDHSALAAVLGASLAGARSYTVTNSQGLLLMTEVAYHAAGLRQPIVMGVANRALSAPHSRFPEQGDAVSQGASGWIQLFCENNQDVLDNTIQAFRIAEKLRNPVMVNYEGYIQSHTLEEVFAPDPEKVTAFLPLNRQPALDLNNPRGVNTVTSPEFYPDYKYQQNEAMVQALTLIPSVAQEYSQEFGAKSCGLVDGYRLEDAEHAIVAMGSIVSTARLFVDEMRKQGKKIGLLKVKTWRPFPAQAILEYLQKVHYVTVLDKNIVFGVGGALATDIKAAAYGQGNQVINGVILGLGGGKCGIEEIQEAVEHTESSEADKNRSEWIGL
ncbi:transketolase C-terminal domain-containing protein [Desulfitobacterium sp.]|uniref:transketolase C-terminal domain-containing protein n=1 Tax=Desulfitobacterium sp. TaxID=49981 RepID=UPI002CC9E7FF|nr:transketolase C-terminal domain-containing protein [Desulfitobacterium sp.]HVJ48961.1 transketolase C-terminal domain-containing protein [Desulfitobacterium sp.]